MCFHRTDALHSHDDITYQSIAKAFGLPLKLHQDAYERMKKLSKHSKTDTNFSWDVESPTKTARLRMVELPTDESRDLGPQALFPSDKLWVPVSVVNSNIHILPGVPRLCKSDPSSSPTLSLGQFCGTRPPCSTGRLIQRYI